jgi:hypothetical protein
MSLGWKKFSFFERDDRRGVQLPENTTCCSGSADYIAFGCDDGQVSSYHSRSCLVESRFLIGRLLQVIGHDSSANVFLLLAGYPV